MKKNIYFLLILAFVFSCDNEPEPEPDVLPSDLSYSVDSLVLENGLSDNSVVPTLKGTKPFSFTLSSTPDNGGNISIDESGVISAGVGLLTGEYLIDVDVKNIVGTVSFDDIFGIRVFDPDLAASNLVYTPDSTGLLLGTAFSSVPPSIEGTAPFTYSITSVTDTDITIDNSGVISATANLDLGTYILSVSVTNSVETTSFDDIYTIVVYEDQGITFTNTIKDLITQNCASCHVPGGFSTDYTDFTNASTSINVILERVQLMSGVTGFMPKNGTALSADKVQLLKDWQTQGLIE